MYVIDNDNVRRAVKKMLSLS